MGKKPIWRKKPQRRKALKVALALRDGLLSPELLCLEGDLLVRCAECESFFAMSVITIGHVLPRSGGGSDRPQNLRLECERCNVQEIRTRRLGANGLPFPIGKSWASEHAHSYSRYVTGRRYDSVEVVDAVGGIVAHTSFVQAEEMAQSGDMEILERNGEHRPTRVRLLKRIPKEKHVEVPLRNECVVCRARRYLSFFRYWPEWHPKGMGLRKRFQSALLCRSCHSEVQRIFTVLLKEALLSSVETGRAVSRRRDTGTLIHLHNRLKQGRDPSEQELKPALQILGLDVRRKIQEVGFEGVAAELSREIRRLKNEAQEGYHEALKVARRRLVASGTDLGAVFWEFVRARQRALQPYLSSCPPSRLDEAAGLRVVEAKAE